MSEDLNDFVHRTQDKVNRHRRIMNPITSPGTIATANETREMFEAAKRGGIASRICALTQENKGPPKKEFVNNNFPNPNPNYSGSGSGSGGNNNFPNPNYPGSGSGGNNNNPPGPPGNFY
jgi:hypothetical protein